MEFKRQKIGLIIPTRYSSERLPGKVLYDINGKPNLQRIVERAEHYKLFDSIILAISSEDCGPIYDWVVKYTEENPDTKLLVYFGVHNDIFKRTLDAANFYDLDIIVDTSHCCSFLDPLMISLLINRMFDYNADYSANCITRSFPDGFDIQIYTRKLYEEVRRSGIYWKEYWTGWNIWQCREMLDKKPRIINMEAEPGEYFPHWRLTLDTETDLNIIREIYKRIDESNDHYPSFVKIINMIKKDKDLLQMVESNSVKPTRIDPEES